MEKIKDMHLDGIGFEDLAKQYLESGGFSAKNLGLGIEIMEKMVNDKECKKFLSFPACVVATGLRGAIAEMISKGLVDVIITTCGTLDHDLARAWGAKYSHGFFEADDADLHKKKIYRLGNIFIPHDDYGVNVENNMNRILQELAKIKEEWSGRELIYEFGKRIEDENSILYQAAKKNIPIYVPGITDGAFGTNLLWFSQNNKFKLNILQDENELATIAFKNKNTGAIMIGGGISKHHCIWWNALKGGLDYAIYITTATQYDGSLSGARLTEAVSWGKIKEDAKYVTIDGDATIILPIILSTIYKKLE